MTKLSLYETLSRFYSAINTKKADKVTNAVNNNFAALDSNGNLKDSGSKSSDFAAASHTHSQYLTSHQDITGKADKVSSPTSGHFAGLDNNGNLTDSGKAAADFAAAVHSHSEYLTSHQSLKSLYGYSLTGSGDITLPMVENATPLYYADIVNKRDAGELVTGKWYRMIDYVTKVYSDDGVFISAEHPFDLLLLAISPTMFSARAKAIQHSGDTYFAKSRLDQWQVWYDINNDTTKYNWADADNGKGVIYRLIDEHNNDCPYDFKNIQFKRWAITDISSTSLTADALSSLKEALVYADNGNRHMANKDIYGNWIPQEVQGTKFTIDEDNSGWYYTFDGISSEDGETPGDHYDMSAHPFRLSPECIQAQLDDDCGTNYADYCKNNIIKSAYYEYIVDDQYYKGRQVLNNIVFANSMSYCYYDEDGGSWNYTTNYCYANVFESECTYNTFGNSCGANTFGNNCYSNTFGNDCRSNTFGNYFCYNTFGNSLYGNTFGNNCSNNTFGNSCYNNTLGNECYNNTFGNDCQYNTFGNYCYSNTFGNYFQNNIFGNNCWYNTFGNNCNNNTFGNDCGSNTFGNNCYRNTFENSCSHNTFGNNCQYITAFEGVQFLDVTGGSTDSDYVRYAQILNGTKGSDENNKLTVAFTQNASYTQIAALKTNGTLAIWNPADNA